MLLRSANFLVTRKAISVVLPFSGAVEFARSIAVVVVVGAIYPTLFGAAGSEKYSK